MNRKQFIQRAGVAAIGLSLAPNLILGQDRPAAYQKRDRVKICRSKSW